MKTRLQVQSWFSYFAETKFVETINVHAIRSIFMYSRISGSIILYYMHCNKLNYTLLQGPRCRLDDE